VFSAELQSGQAGVQFQVPPNWEVVEETPKAIQAIDHGQGLMWHILALPFCLGIDPAHDKYLVRDLTRDTRQAFDRAFEELRAEQQGQPASPLTPTAPRTAQGDWSAFVEWSRFELAGGTGVRFVYRIAYEPGCEHVVGRIQIPVASGVVQFTCHAIANETGFRETTLSMLIEQTQGRKGTQADFDDTRHDAQFGTHVLSRARKGLTWALQRLTLTQPPPPWSQGSVVLAEAESVITPPPRYVRLPPGTLPMASSIANFTRIGYEAATTPRLCEVYMLSGHRLEPTDREGLKALAVAETKKWEAGGVQDLRWQTNWSPDTRGRIEMAMHVTFRTERGVHSAQYWTIDRDGTPFRVSCSAPQYITFKELAKDTSRAMRSWSRVRGR
jgi:hypothetical protein